MTNYIKKSNSVRVYHLGFETSDPDWFTRGVFDGKLTRSSGDTVFVLVKTPEGTLKAHMGDYIIYEAPNFYVCSSATFASIYESEDTIPLGKYRHYKGNIYNVTGKGIHTETSEPMVIYETCDGTNKVWIRPASMWNDTVVGVNGQPCKRFIKI